MPKSTPNPQGEFLLYTVPSGAIKVDVFFQDESVWLTQKALTDLFGVGRPAITKHLKNIFETGELDENLTCSKMEQVADNGKTYEDRSPH
ncbi:hypothetical protein [uncultured Thiothrix sp.]|uniref:hypothetical protein n=1 Tax=uncultured Thiothrix sp. TaxID=223185 RepID=UPI0026244B85|nr:hypothetical protein [uncultured Thiothrix sp.]HMT94470.1 hypothetical protein [Thiolinea sp.]